MDLIPLALLLIALLFALLGAGLWIAVALGAIGLVAMVLKTTAPVGITLATSVWQSSISWDLTALPMFIWMGEILYRTRLSEDMFEGLAPWLSRLPAAYCTSTSSALHHLRGSLRVLGGDLRHHRQDRDAPVAQAGLRRAHGHRHARRLRHAGPADPPSIIMIVYAAATDQSIARLFIAGVVPGIMLALLFGGFIVVWALLNRRRMPPPEPRESFANRMAATRRLIPVVLLIVGVIGSIYGGLASATEAAVVGVVLSLVLSASMGTLSRRSFVDALMGATRTSCMIAFILAGAAFLTTAMGFHRHPARPGGVDLRLQPAGPGSCCSP